MGGKVTRRFIVALYIDSSSAYGVAVPWKDTNARNQVLVAANVKSRLLI